MRYMNTQQTKTKKKKIIAEDEKTVTCCLKLQRYIVCYKQHQTNWMLHYGVRPLSDTFGIFAQFFRNKTFLETFMTAIVCSGSQMIISLNRICKSRPHGKLMLITGFDDSHNFQDLTSQLTKQLLQHTCTCQKLVKLARLKNEKVLVH